MCYISNLNFKSTVASSILCFYCVFVLFLCSSFVRCIITLCTILYLSELFDSVYRTSLLGVFGVYLLFVVVVGWVCFGVFLLFFLRFLLVF